MAGRRPRKWAATLQPAPGGGGPCPRGFLFHSRPVRRNRRFTLIARYSSRVGGRPRPRTLFPGRKPGERQAIRPARSRKVRLGLHITGIRGEPAPGAAVLGSGGIRRKSRWPPLHCVGGAGCDSSQRHPRSCFPSQFEGWPGSGSVVPAVRWGRPDRRESPRVGRRYRRRPRSDVPILRRSRRSDKWRSRE